MCTGCGAGIATAADDSGSSVKSTLLKGGARDSESMQSSLKLLAPTAQPPKPPAPPPSPPARPVQSPFQLNTGANQFGSRPIIGIPMPAPHPSLNVDSKTYSIGVQRVPQLKPVPVAPPIPRPYVPPEFNPGITTWVENPGELKTQEAGRANNIADLQTAIKRLHSGQKLAPAVAPAAQSMPLIPVHQGFEAVPTFTPSPVWTTHVEQPEMRASQLALPTVPPVGTWDAWYQRVAKAMYNRWQQNHPGAGLSTVLITAYNTRDVDCRITTFTPAEGASRDAAAEGQFKNTALQCVSSLSKDPVWQFPTCAGRLKKVTFEIELKHAVGEDNGCRVVHKHGDIDETKVVN